MLMIPAVVGAQPTATPAPPAPDSGSDWPLPDEMTVALRAGLVSLSYESGCDSPPSSDGVGVDAEVGWRPVRWFSLAGFVAYAHVSTTDPGLMIDDRFGITDLGVRAQFHLGYVFLGGGYGTDHVAESSTYAASMLGPAGSGTYSFDHSMFEVHAGVSIPVHPHVAIEGLVMYTQAPAGGDPMNVQTVRFVFGARLL